MEIDNENDRCLIKLLLMKGSLGLKDRVFLWFLKRGLPNYDLYESHILHTLRGKGLLNYDEEKGLEDFKKDAADGVFWMNEREQYYSINEKGERAIYGKVFKSESVHSFNMFWSAVINIIVALICGFGGYAIGSS